MKNNIEYFFQCFEGCNDLYDYHYGFPILPINSYSLLTIILVLVISLLTVVILSNKLKINPLMSFSIFLWHTLFCIIYIFYVYSNKGDATKFFFRSFDEFYITNAFGSKFIITITGLFSNFLSFNYIAVSLIFNLIGSIGVFLLFDVLNKNKLDNKNYFFITCIIIFLPSLSFWSSSIGKDSITFLSISLLLWSIYNKENNFFYKYFSLLLLFMARPHYGIIGLSIFILFDIIFKKTTFNVLLIKIIFIIILALSSPFIFQFLTSYTGYYSVTAETTFSYKGLLSFIEIRSRYELSASFYDVKNYSYILKVFSFLFRPLPFEANNLFQLVVSFENVLIIILILYLSINKFLTKKSTYNSDYFSLLFFALIYLNILSITTANLGIANRQKWIILPIIFVFLIIILKKNYEKK